MSSIIKVVALALQRSLDSRYMVARRAPSQSGAGFWEFPGGKIDQGETQVAALIREIQEEFGFTLKANDLSFFAENSHQYPTCKVHLFLWTAKLDIIPDMNLTDHDLVAWCKPSEMKNYNISAADVYFINKLL